MDYTANISEVVLIEAYGRIGIDVSTELFPAERALAMSNSGAVDGEVNRIKGLEGKYPNLIMIPVPINWIVGVAVTKRNDIVIDKGWESLRPYAIGLRIGAKYAEIGTSDMNVSAVATNDLAFKMLDRERVDLVVSTLIETKLTIKNQKFENMIILDPPLVELELFHYLHKKNEDLLPRISAALVSMANEGRILEIRDAELAKLF